jgi:hypothetical protein
MYGTATEWQALAQAKRLENVRHLAGLRAR